MFYVIWLVIIQLYSFDKKSMTKSHALGIRITCIMLILGKLINPKYVFQLQFLIDPST